MSTRSLIGQQNADGTVSYIYCHFDGYLDNVGEILQAHYQSGNKVAALIALGDISSLGSEIGEAHDFNWRNEYYRAKRSYQDDPRNKMCNAYGRDRGESGTEAKTTSRDRFLIGERTMGAEYCYLWTGNAWIVRSYDETPRTLADALATVKAED